MKHVLVEFIGTPLVGFDASVIKTTFDSQGIRGFAADFLSLSPEDVTQLPDTTIPEKRKLVCVLSYYHSASRVAEGPIDIMTTNKQMF